EVGAETARRLGLSGGDVVRVASPHGRVELPVYVADGLHPTAAAIPLGLGHSEYGRFAQAVGQSPLALLPGEPEPASGGPRWLSVRVTLEKTGRREPLATPAGVTEVDHEREIIETVPAQPAIEAEKSGRPAERANLPSMYPDIKYPEHR